MSKKYKRYLKLKRRHKTIQRKLERETKRLSRAMAEVFGI